MEEIAKQITIYVSLALEILAGIIIAVGVLRFIIKYIGTSLKMNNGSVELRTQFGRSVSLALELMLGADVLETAVAPSWNDIGQLAAIATIRTVLNYFLGKELKEIQPATEK